ncbi:MULTISPECIES: bifunctional transcriptional activator/DNA repair enzyme AdaA [Chryseobacterium]|uniref:AraC family transcriptional regulator of adaptative response/methylated-DNA-[protein]-cysteine methyltransferase n=1 Tax=Chryseobacterium camelliae TaxID=1265445 RepID=A0ABU0TDM3_9FLAO|nr:MULTISPECIES: methylated-DNA--[protein]-cysteine S-methyltransferase [Chryseobacterium]MDT3407034.1 AraC family transcriptional regulator of adaptative response/methylated-DNA-[protein]-cysteine methyltransferase [Pseudacidovorax intermedius]MDQ1095174.1 AraC family transcriptional regulator of adaptative response/methylated-DNA-[protein]-cysteine methyltransferase [Chryseobacterium camelliae]MDQ1099112.1 AraC family transcriptional regulator of adaptative response/methylated-DNA-[protein]-cy
MFTQSQINYQRIAKAIAYIQENFLLQPGLEEVAEKIHLSPAHFQKIFTEWAGTSPKKFLQYISLEHAKKLLHEGKASVADTAYETGLSSTSRLHEMFVNIEGMSPAEYKNGGRSLEISYSYSDSPFGSILTASTQKGICHMAFEEDKEKGLENLKLRFPNASFLEHQTAFHISALSIFSKDWNSPETVKLHLRGTDFQLKVWQSLLTIPAGKLSTYGSLAEKIGHSRAPRAVGTAIGNNPVAFLIPCHRVILSSGEIGGYHWGSHRKQLIIGWENALTDPENLSFS